MPTFYANATLMRYNLWIPLDNNVSATADLFLTPGSQYSLPHKGHLDVVLFIESLSMSSACDIYLY